MRCKVFAFLYATSLLFSCSDDVDVATESIRPLAEVAAENDAEIQAFLQSVCLRLQKAIQFKS